MVMMVVMLMVMVMVMAIMISAQRVGFSVSGRVGSGI